GDDFIGDCDVTKPWPLFGIGIVYAILGIILSVLVPRYQSRLISSLYPLPSHFGPHDCSCDRRSPSQQVPGIFDDRQANFIFGLDGARVARGSKDADAARHQPAADIGGGRIHRPMPLCSQWLGKMAGTT